MDPTPTLHAPRPTLSPFPTDGKEGKEGSLKPFRSRERPSEPFTQVLCQGSKDYSFVSVTIIVIRRDFTRKSYMVRNKRRTIHSGVVIEILFPGKLRESSVYFLTSYLVNLMDSPLPTLSFGTSGPRGHLNTRKDSDLTTRKKNPVKRSEDSSYK